MTMVAGARLIPAAVQLGARPIAGVCTSRITRSGALSWIEDTNLESSTQVTVIPDSHSSSEQISLRLAASGSDTKTRIGSAWADALDFTFTYFEKRTQWTFSTHG